MTEWVGLGPPDGPVGRPLTPAQEGVWVFERLNPGTSVFVISHFGWLRTALDRAALDRAFAALVSRHDALRSTFSAHRETPCRLAHGPSDVAAPRMSYVDLRAAADAPKRAARAMAAEEAVRPFDLDHGPLVRMVVYRTGDTEHAVLMAAHHLVCDGASLRIALAELAESYQGEQVVERCDVADPAPVRADDEAYWRAQLDGTTPCQLPAGRSRRKATFRAGRLEAGVPPELADRVAELAAAEGATPFMVVLAAFQVVLSRWSGQREFAVGCPVSGRTRADLRQAVGLLVNTVVIRADLTGEPTFRHLLARVRSTVLTAFRHQRCPVERVAPATPAFRTRFVFHTFALEDLPFAGGTLRPERLDSGDVQHELELHVWPQDGGLNLVAEFHADTFGAGMIDRLLSHVVTVLRAAVAAPDTVTARLDMLGADERRLLADWGAGGSPAERDDLAAMFAATVERSPDATAVEAEDGTVTFAELDSWSNRAAALLRRSGIGPDDVVGVRMGRSCALVATLLGVVKSGAAYLPIDPAYPRARSEFMMRDASARMVLTEQDVTQEALAGFTGEPVSVPVSPEHLAYLIYTSGSTGRPKGVAITRGNLATFVGWVRQAFSPDELRRVLAATSICFDLSVFEIFGTLVAGGTVVLAPGDAVRYLSSRTARNVSLINTVPSVFGEIMRADGLPDSVRAVNLAGEALPRTLVEAAHAVNPAVRLCNLYGPSETTTYSTGGVVRPEDDPPPIGRPLPGERMLVVDDALELVPGGAVGELCIGGVGVARGYRGRAGLTAARFVPDPLGGNGERVYRTGDLVRYQDDGVLVFVGRRDAQVKVRGFRVEPGEVEACLVRCPGVRAAAVTTHRGGLVGYVVGDADLDAVRAFVRERLPDHLVPGFLRTLPALPLTPNGKVDRAALPAPETARPVAAPPRTGPEAVVAAIWAEVLGLDTVGADEDFFALGGHSLAAMRVVARLRDVLDVDLPVRAVFDHPTVAELTSALDGAGSTTTVPIGPVDRAHVPASFAQQRLWFLSTLDPDADAAYVLQGAIRLVGQLDVARLRRALQRVVDRHEPLRTGLVDDSGELLQAIATHCRLDLGSVTCAEAEVERIAERDRRPFDLRRPPLLRATLAGLDEETHVLLLTAHHVICDGWSLAVFFADLASAYEHDADLPELPVQHADFAVWQQENQETTDGDLGYWRARLAGVGPLELPTDRPRPAHQSFHGGRVSFELTPDLVAKLEELSRDTGTTLFMVILAAFQTVLARWSGQHDFAVGTPVAGRGHPGLEHAIGLFVETLVLRADLRGDPSFRELLARVREATLSALAHQDTPFDRVVAAVDPARDTSRSPLFQAFFAMQNTPSVSPGLVGLRAEPLDLPSDTAMFDLWLSVTPARGGATGWLQYNSDLFDAGTAGRLVSHVVNVLSVVVDVDHPLSTVDMTNAEERARLAAWGDGGTAVESRGLVASFVSHVRTSPGAVAVACLDDVVTYAELDRWSNQLAHSLRDRGVCPEDVVGVRTGRTAGLVAALLAVMKVGAAYLPIDPEYPRERVRFMLDHAKARVVLGDEDVARDALAGRSDEPVEVAVPPDGLAYLIYTSGSTGTPKGVEVTRGNLVAFLDAVAAEVPVRAGDVLPAITTLSFDIAGLEIWLPLTRGARIAMVERDVVLDPAALGTRLDAVGATIVQATPTTWRMLLDAGWRPSVEVRGLCGGEALTAALAERLLATGMPVHHVYGPTETTVWSSHTRLTGTGAVSLGRPLPGEQMSVVDDEFRPVPVGVVGELCVGGVGVARGYRGRAGLTAARFVPDPLGSSGERVYRTGDLVRYRDDGVLVFVGRRDAQVKVRGFRVELGEVEACLVRCPGVRAAAAAARGDELLGYVVGDVDIEAVRAFAGDRLPGYLVPDRILPMATLPLTPNGKVDRNALPTPAAEESGPPTVTRSNLEELVTSAWTEALGVRPGPDDNFFGIGGHSLTAARVAIRLAEALDVAVPVRMLFEHPTVSGLAAAIRFAQPDRQVRPVPRTEGEITGPASEAQERIWFAAQLDPKANTAYTVQGAWQLDGPLDVSTLEWAITVLCRRHEPLRTGFRTEGDQLRQVIAPDATVSLDRVELSTTDMTELAAVDARPFDLSSPPLMRATLATVEKDRHILLLTAHHLVCDGWSVSVFANELGVLYRTRDEHALPELPLQHLDFTAWQRKAGGLDYWTGQLEDLAPLDLPTDRLRQQDRGHACGVVSSTVDPEALGAVRRLAAETGCTPFMVLLATFQVLLHRHSGQRDIAVGVPVAGRDQPGLDRAIGLFVNALVLRGQLDPDGTVAALLDQNRHVTIDAMAHQDCPFERIGAAINRTPPTRVMFNYLNLPSLSLDLAGLRVTSIDTPRHVAKFELDLYLRDTEDGGLALLLEFDRALFEPDTAGQLLAHFGALLEQFPADPSRTIGDLWLPVRTRSPRSVKRAGKSIVDRFAEVVASGPDRVAVHTPDQPLTYRELAEQAWGIADAITGLGLAGSPRIGVLSADPAHVPAALLGVLAAGAAYVPLDADAPAEHLTRQANVAGITALVTDGTGVGDLPTIRVSARRTVDSLARRPAPDAIAYLLFTSGSEGEPKAVVQNHQNVLLHVDNYADAMGIGRDDRLSLVSHYTFDAAVLDVFAALLTGATLVPVDVRSSAPDEVTRQLGTAGVTVYHSTPTVFRHLLEHGDDTWTGTGIRAVVLGGEEVRMSDVDGLDPFGPECQLVNLFGAAECTLATLHRVDRRAQARELVPIGGPVPGIDIALTTEAGDPTEPFGRMACRGPQVALGYWDPATGDVGLGTSPACTGDLARRLPDGSLVFAGRASHQLKVRGQRIAAADVEARLRSWPGVRDAAVAAQQDPHGEPHLVAYLACDTEPEPGALRGWLRTVLPPHQVPDRYVPVHALPHTRTGKLDRRRLPEPEWAAGVHREPPATDLERDIARIWQEVLGREPVGRHDDFFELGGHSLLANAIVARIRQHTGLAATLRHMFDHPTVASLAATLTDHRPARQETGAIIRRPRVPYRVVKTGNGEQT